MKSYYEVIINGYTQSLVKFDNKRNVFEWLDQLKADGRLKATDKVIIRTTIVIEDEIKFYK